MSSFQNADGSFFRESGGQPVVVAEPASASTYAMTSTTRVLYIANAATLASLTIKLPPGVRNGDRVEIGFESAVTALTVQDSFGAAITGAPTAGAANAAVVMIYVKSAQYGVATWVHWK